MILASDWNALRLADIALCWREWIELDVRGGSNGMSTGWGNIGIERMRKTDWLCTHPGLLWMAWIGMVGDEDF